MQLILTHNNAKHRVEKPYQSTTLVPNLRFLLVVKETGISFPYPSQLFLKQNKRRFSYLAMEVVNHLVEQKPLVIFTKSSCCMSHSVQQLLSSYGANATVYQLDDLPNEKEVEKALQRLGLKPTVPAVFIGQKFVGGAKEIISMQVQGRLTPMLKEAGAIWV
ncbi:hypothetical protein RND81_04G080300 [Saponaria officinalis]|uniref:Glutaredoxin domain-containing protein n=1 Tax=Saponaria officinalis TaxID=3572 RepID=A0AAW1LJX6_SAPOF